ncbi:B-zip transcription factor [Teratosphaeria destructans]|uniref:B-zip transcription factor n=1 Tax=Teratosphaeria destructans TaxID=418781 RepID=A0A9W7W5I2_9PEZI|nr:B-zip transcription factor [Teratosphaeria destructans]
MDPWDNFLPEEQGFGSFAWQSSNDIFQPPDQYLSDGLPFGFNEQQFPEESYTVMNRQQRPNGQQSDTSQADVPNGVNANSDQQPPTNRFSAEANRPYDPVRSNTTSFADRRSAGRVDPTRGTGSGSQMMAGQQNPNPPQQSGTPTGYINILPGQPVTPAWVNMNPGQQTEPGFGMGNFRQFGILNPRSHNNQSCSTTLAPPAHQPAAMTTIAIKVEPTAVPNESTDPPGSQPHTDPYGLGRMSQQNFRPSAAVAGTEDNNHHYGQQHHHHRRSESDTSSSAKVPLPPRNNSTAGAAQTPPAPSGPMSSSVTVPPRPRPGRKPIPQEDAADRRRLQNRNAQRNFRDKRQQRLAETLHEVEQTKKMHQDTVSEYERRIDELKRNHAAQMDHLRQHFNQRLREAQELTDHLRSQLQKQEQRDSIFPHHNGYTRRSYNGLTVDTRAATRGTIASAPTPPEELATDYTDAYTASWRSQQPRPSMQSDRPTHSSDGLDAMELTPTQQGARDCGFCNSGNAFCPCDEQRKSLRAVKTTVAQPGTCEQCQRDPERAKACRDLARGSQLQSRPSSSQGDGSELSPMSMPAPATTSCSTMLDMVRRAGDSARGMAISDIMGPVQTYPRENGGYDIGIDEREAASALQSLSRRNTIHK